VINGKEGVNSVVSEWTRGAAPYVTGSKGSLSKKFDNFDLAWKHVSSHLAMLEGFKQAEAIAAAKIKQLESKLKTQAIEVYPRPPLSLIGPDKSLKK
jgi:hypothetical protein